MSEIDDLKGRQEALRKQMAEVYEQAGPDYDFSKVTSLGDGDTASKVAEFNKMDAELNDVSERAEQHEAHDARKQRLEEMTRVNRAGLFPADGNGNKKTRGDRDMEPKSFGEMFTESQAYTGKSGPVGPTAIIQLPGTTAGDLRATLMTTTAGWVPETTRTGRLVESAQRPIQVTDLIPAGRTIQNAVVFMKESTFTNAAAETAEGGTYAESALALTETTSAVRKIATFLPVTDEQLDDVAGLQSYIDNRLGFMLRQRLDSQILVGNGTPPNLLGLNNLASIQTQAKGADPVPDAIFKAMTLIRITGRANPSGVVINPTDWQDVKLLRTADGIYIWGNPADNAPDRIWGLPVAISDAQTLNTALVGDFANFSELVLRKDVEVQISNSHSTFFIEGKQAIRADMRVALVAYRDEAFCKVTGV